MADQEKVAAAVDKQLEYLADDARQVNLPNRVAATVFDVNEFATWYCMVNRLLGKREKSKVRIQVLTRLNELVAAGTVEEHPSWAGQNRFYRNVPAS